MTHPLTPREKVSEQTVGPVNYDRLRSAIHSATHAALPFAEAPMTIPFSTQERAALQAEIVDLIISNLDKATAPLAALASSGDQLSGNPGILKSGDHAELARLADMADWMADGDPGANGSVLLSASVASEHAADLRALLAEIAALRERGDRLNERCRRFHDQVASQSTRATEAERKLAEAVGILRWIAADDEPKLGNGNENDLLARQYWNKARTFLSSKEAERG